MIANEKEYPGTTGLEIAVIGMSGRFPGARNINEFWDNLKNGVESISFFSDEELTAQGVDPQLLKNPNYIKAKGSITGEEYFDASFFGYTPREASILDPQARFFIECAWEALEDSGYDPGSYTGLIGVFAGAAENIFWRTKMFSSLNDRIENFSQLYLANKDFVTLWVSYKLGLKGPSSMVYTACSTSLVAIHMACQALLNGECDMAMAGGVRIALPNKLGYLYVPDMVNSPDGHCRAFDKSSRGILSGNGVGVVILKRLEEAIEDRDHIYAVVKGSAINNDGLRKVGFLAPSIEGQAEAIRTALHMARVEPESITYIEAHGTGTELGDPVEIEGLKSAFDTDSKGFCAIGAVKANVGHLDIAAGVTGFIKTVLALKNKLIPPSLHFKEPNPKIDFKNSPFYVNTKLREWKNNKYPLRAGVSSFGLGGTNVHVILEEAPVDWLQKTEGTRQTAGTRKYQLILLSAKTKTALDKMSENLALYLESNPGTNLADVTYTLQVGRKPFLHRRMLVCSNTAEVIHRLKSGEVETGTAKEVKHSVIFMFSGQGSQYVNMGLDLYNNEPVFRRQVDECFKLLENITGIDMKPVLYPDGKTITVEEAEEKIFQFRYTTPIKFIFEYSLAGLLIKWGIRPDAMIGHSFGEYAAACLSGVFSLEDGLFLAALRGELMQGLPDGAMLSVPLAEEELKQRLTPKDELSIAAVNGESLCVVSGPVEAVNRFEEQLKQEGHECLRYQVPKAGHSRMVEPIMEEFKKKIRKVKFHKPRIPFVSSISGRWITPEEATAPAYWTRHVRETVRFVDGLTTLFKETDPIFLQISPGKGLMLFINQHPGKKEDTLTLTMARHRKDPVPDVYHTLTQIGRLWLKAYDTRIDWQAFYGEEKRRRISLPSYPFAAVPYPVDKNVNRPGAPNIQAVSTGPRHPGQRKKPDMREWFYIPSWERAMLPPGPPGQKQEQPGTSPFILLFLDKPGLGPQIKEQLEQEGISVITVKTGTAFKKTAHREYTLNPCIRENYDDLVKELETRDEFPSRFFHLWSLWRRDRNKPVKDNIDEALDCGFYSLLFLVQAISKRNLNLNRGIRIEVVTGSALEVTGEEELCPGSAPVYGLCRVIPQEYPDIHCRCIDITLPPDGPIAEKRVKQLMAELLSSSTDGATAYRGDYRWLESYKSLPLEKPQPAALPLKEGGVYVITGGLGAIGMVLGKYLAKSFKAKLILTGRSDFPPGRDWTQDSVSPKIRELLEMKEMGAQVLVMKADVSNLDQMQDVFTRAEKEFGPINGVIHSAGIGPGKSFTTLAAMKKKDVQLHFEPKIYGLLVLEEILKNRPVDFCLLMSSTASVLGELGLGAYSAANRFMDTYIHLLNRSSRTRWISVNWDAWRLEEKQSQEMAPGPKIKEPAITPEEGQEILERILGWKEAKQVIQCTGDLQTRMQQWVKPQTLPSPDLEAETIEEKPGAISRQKRPHMSTPYIPPQKPWEKELARIWEDLLGFEEIGAQDNFFELGGDSLGLLKLVGAIKRELNLEIPMVQLILNPTISELSNYIHHEQYRETIDAAINGKYILLNTRNEKYKNVFCFPPGIATGIAYINLAQQLSGYNIYSFNFIEDDRCIRQYADTIIEIQEKGPYCLFGYSSGGNLAFETALELEQRGHEVSDIIIGDSNFRNEVLILTPESFENKNVNFVTWVETEMENLGLGHLKERVLERAQHYAQYYHSNSDRGKVNARVHLITAINRKENPVLTADSESGVIQNMDWKDVGTSYAVYEGFGVHEKMFSPGFVEENAAIIRKILEASQSLMK